MEAVDKGYIPLSLVTRTLFGGRMATHARVGARDFKTLQTLGHQPTKEVWQPDTDVATRIAERALAEETVELDLVDAAALEDSVLD